MIPCFYISNLKQLSFWMEHLNYPVMNMLCAKCRWRQSTDCPAQTSDLNFAQQSSDWPLNPRITPNEVREVWLNGQSSDIHGNPERSYLAWNHAPWIVQSSDCACTKCGCMGKSRVHSSWPTLQTLTNYKCIFVHAQLYVHSLGSASVLCSPPFLR